MADMTRGITQYLSRLPIDPYLSIVDKKNTNYCRNLESSSGFGGTTWVAFGNLGNDTFRTSIDGTSYNLVGSPVEYYYTDLVFLRNDYETALVGLYRNLAEMPNKRGEINEAIGLVKEVAKRRNVNLDERQAKNRYRREIVSEIAEAGKTYSIGRNELNLITSYYLGETSYNGFKNKLQKYRYEQDSYSTFEKIVFIITTLNADFASSLSADTIRF